jgi:endoglucanase
VQCRAFLQAIAALALVVGWPQVRAADSSRISLNEKEYFEAPGFSFLVFHNNYQIGYQGGLQMIENGERVLDSGDLLLVPKRGERPAQQRVLRRTVDRAAGTATVFGDLGDLGGYRLICRAEGGRMVITLALDKPVDWTRFAQAGFRVALYPGTYVDKSYQSDSASGVFPRQYGGRVLVASSSRLKIAQEDPLHTVLIVRPGGELSLADQRQSSPQPWFQVLAPLAPGSSDRELTVEITPAIHPEWRRPPVIAIAQTGYHPAQAKRAVIEIDPRDAAGAMATLYRLRVDGDRVPVKSAAAKPWGRFLRYQYEIFDFSEVREPGMYVLESRGVSAGPFEIGARVYDEAWRPTLEYFLPVQMCHVAVQEGNRTWHGACHLDDARQAPQGLVHIDGYQQGQRETRFADDEHIPGLNWGGWHDAGDHDLPGGSIANTTLYLALAQEEFHPSLDQTSIDRARRQVLLHVADGRQDMIEQVEYGVEGLLGSYRTSGHIFPGIIERSHPGYSHLGDPVNITDNKVDDEAAPKDDRWAFTNRNTGLQYEAVQALAVASRVLTAPNPALAAESLRAARDLYDYEQRNAPVYPPNAYVPRDSGFRSQELSATAELLLTTGEQRYRDRLIALLPDLRRATAEEFAAGPGWTLVRALPAVPEPEFQAAVRGYALQWKALLARWTASNPYGVPLPPAVTEPDYHLEERSGIHSSFVWGSGWNLQLDALRQYYLHKHLPDLFDADLLYNVLDFVLGCHPANSQSFVSGVGAESAVPAYGFNRADWSYIPGGVISGASLIKPDLMELKVFPFLWYQTEYVIHGAASYIFDALATDRLLNGGGASKRSE